MELGIIQKNDLQFSAQAEDDRTNTVLTLDDYDWMNYTLTTKFKTQKYGVLDVSFNYSGATTSFMEVVQNFNDVTEQKTFEYPTDIFIKHIVKFLKNHIESWNSKYAFNGENEVLLFYNDVIKFYKNKKNK